MKITGTKVAELTCPPGRKDILVFDDTLPGFGVRISANGTKTFIAQYNLGTVRRRMPIGKFGKDKGQFTEPKARDKAHVIIGAVKDGRDPYREYQMQIASAEEAAAATRAKAKVDLFTVEKLIGFWNEDREKVGRRDGYLRIATGALRRGLEDDLKRPAAEITEDEAEQRIQDIEENSGPIAANRLLAYARAAFGRAVRARKLDLNPFARIDAPSGEEGRSRILSNEEVACIWRAATALPAPYGAWVRMLLLTGQRRSEVAGMKWSELSDDTWLIPGGRAKNGLAHLVHITEPMKDILAAARTTQETVDAPSARAVNVFPGERGKPVSGFSLAKRLIDAALIEERQKAKLKPVELDGWTWHDLRRTQQTWLVAAGFNSDVVDRIANHREGKATGVKGIYQRYEYLTERKAALEAWCKHVVAVAEERDPASNVVQLPARVA
jgi:integrase